MSLMHVSLPGSIPRPPVSGAQAALGEEVSSLPSWVDRLGPSHRGDDQAKVAFVHVLDPGAQKKFHDFFQ